MTMRDEARRPAPAQPVPLPTASVLVIDDDSALRDSLRVLLEVHGFRVLTASDGWRGLAAFREHAPAVVVTDILMPEQDGIGAIMQMRQERPNARISAMSG